MDVTAEIVITAPPETVAAVMFNPANDPRWIGGARSVDASGPAEIGARVRRHGGFLGRRFSWVTEVEAFQPDRLLAMRFVEGPLKGAVSYEIEPAPAGSRVRIRNRGGSTFSFPGMGWMVRQGVSGDLKRLKAIVEGGR